MSSRLDLRSHSRGKSLVHRAAAKHRTTPLAATVAVLGFLNLQAAHAQTITKSDSLSNQHSLFTDEKTSIAPYLGIPALVTRPMAIRYIPILRREPVFARNI